MEQIMRGISTSSSPFITSILAPQLKLRRLPLFFVDTFKDLPSVSATYALLDGDSVLTQPMEYKRAITSYLSTQVTSIALTFTKAYKQKVELLEMGFHHCIEIPTAPEVIIRTIENNLNGRGTGIPGQLRDSSTTEYQTTKSLSYAHDQDGKHFLLNNTRSVYLNVNEQRILEYFMRREGFASKNELAYAGWKNFDVKPNTVTVTIKKLRKKIQIVKLPYEIRCLYGYGYILEKLTD